MERCCGEGKTFSNIQEQHWVHWIVQCCRRQTFLPKY